MNLPIRIVLAIACAAAWGVLCSLLIEQTFAGAIFAGVGGYYIGGFFRSLKE